jgi:methionine--tRNA ligase beta chain
MINYDEFSKVELKVAKVLQAERVEKSDKLLKLQVSLGEEERQIVAGIGKSYSPEELIDEEIIIVANLEPRTLFGLESQGMLLAASDDETVALLKPGKPVKPGSSIR